MKNFTRMILYAYPRLPRLIETTDSVIREMALRSFYDRSDGDLVAEKLLVRIQRKNALVRIKQLVESGLNTLSGTEREILAARFSGQENGYRKNAHAFSKTTYYRRLKRGVARLESYLYQHGAENVFRDAELQKTAYFQFLHDHLKEMRRPLVAALAVPKPTVTERADKVIPEKAKTFRE